jgi:hypothetical protein
LTNLIGGMNSCRATTLDSHDRQILQVVTSSS